MKRVVEMEKPGAGRVAVLETDVENMKSRGYKVCGSPPPVADAAASNGDDDEPVTEADVNENLFGDAK